jgi:acyl-CoA thioester hydrolase
MRALGRARLDIEQDITHELWSSPEPDEPPPRLLCSAAVRVGCVDAATFRPTRIPQPLLSELNR